VRRLVSRTDRLFVLEQPPQRLGLTFEFHSRISLGGPMPASYAHCETGSARQQNSVNPSGWGNAPT